MDGLMILQTYRNTALKEAPIMFFNTPTDDVMDAWTTIGRRTKPSGPYCFLERPKFKNNWSWCACPNSPPPFVDAKKTRAVK